MTAPDAVASFETILARLTQAYGDVHIGAPVTDATLRALERELGVKLPEDYRRFVSRYGFLYAARGAFVVFGVPPAGVGYDFEVDVRRATAQLADIARERAATNPALATALEAAAPLVPVFGKATDFPSHQVHVLDSNGDVRWFLVEHGDLTDSLGETFEQLLADQVGARGVLQAREPYRGATYVAPETDDGEDDEDDGVTSEAAERAVTEYRRLLRVPEIVAHALQTEPALLDTFLLYETRAELLVYLGEDVPDPDIHDEGILRVLAVTEGMPDDAPFLRPVMEIDDYLAPLIFVLTRETEAAALAAQHPIARATCGDIDVPADIRTRLIEQIEVALLARIFETLVDDVYANHSNEDDESTDHDADDVQPLAELATELSKVYADAADAGDAILVRYAYS